MEENKDTFYCYIKDSSNIPVATIVIRDDVVGTSVCSVLDNFSYEDGRKYAIERIEGTDKISAREFPDIKDVIKIQCNQDIEKRIPLHRIREADCIIHNFLHKDKQHVKGRIYYIIKERALHYTLKITQSTYLTDMTRAEYEYKFYPKHSDSNFTIDSYEEIFLSKSDFELLKSILIYLPRKDKK